MRLFIEQLISLIRENQAGLGIGTSGDKLLIHRCEKTGNPVAGESLALDVHALQACSGIDPILLPEPELLELDEAACLADALLGILHNLGCYPNFPHEYPSELKYPFVKAWWNADPLDWAAIGEETRNENCEIALHWLLDIP